MPGYSMKSNHTEHHAFSVSRVVLCNIYQTSHIWTASSMLHSIIFNKLAKATLKLATTKLLQLCYNKELFVVDYKIGRLCDLMIFITFPSCKIFIERGGTMSDVVSDGGDDSYHALPGTDLFDSS